MARLFFLALLAACKPVPSSDVDHTPKDEETPLSSCPEDDGSFADLAQLFEDERIALDAPGRAVAVFHDGEIVWCAGLGTDRPNQKSGTLEPDALFRIASITKPLTAIAVLQEVDRGTVSLDDPIPTHLEDWSFVKNPGWADQMTVHHLLTHQGGMYDYLQIEGATTQRALENFVEDELVNAWFMMSPPGAMWNYSNDNFMVAGRVLEVADGRYYPDRLTADVFRPLGMERTFFDPEDVLADGNYAVSKSYDWDGHLTERRVTPDAYDNGWARPAGYAWSNVEDLARLGMWVMEGDEAILSDALRLEMQEPHSDLLMPLPGISHYGYGWFSDVGLQTDDGLVEVPVVHHMGDLPGFSGDLYLFPSADLGIAVLTSADYAHTSHDTLAEAVGLFTELPAPVPMALDTSTLDLNAYVDVFDDPYNVGPMEFYLDDGALAVNMPLLNLVEIPYSHELIPWTPDNFFLEIQGLYLVLTFIEEDGSFRWARTRFFVGERDQGTPMAAAQPDPQRLLERLQQVADPALRSHPLR